MNVIIGIDPHKATHTAVAVDGNEAELGEIQVRANSSQLKRLLAWAAPFETRTLGRRRFRGGCGYLLAQQLVAGRSREVEEHRPGLVQQREHAGRTPGCLKIEVGHPPAD